MNNVTNTVQVDRKPPKVMDLNEFRDQGFLQEANRLFFHPLGLALFVVLEEDGTISSLGCYDDRDDPEGWIFGGRDHTRAIKATLVEAELNKHVLARLKMFNNTIQPLDTMI